MTEQSGEQHADLAAIQADDALLDALGRGEQAPAGDGLAGLLVAWRTELATDLPSDTITLPVTEPAPPRRDSASNSGPDSDSGPDSASDSDSGPGLASGPGPGWRRSSGLRRGSGWRRALVGAVAAAVLLGGAALGAQRSGPDGPLWPLTRVLYPQLTDVREAEHAIAQAHDAAAARKYDDARRFLDVASGHAERVTDPATRQRLRDEIERLRRSLPAQGAPTAGTSPATPTAPATPTPTPAPTPVPATTTPAPGTGAGAGTGAGGAQPPPAVNPVPGLKSLLPSLPVPKLPVPSLPLPSLPLPPLPTLPGLGG